MNGKDSEIWIDLGNNKKLHAIGLGTWKSQPGVVRETVEEAIKVGYRHIDCAHVYGNEQEIGEAVAKAINTGVVKREDLFITSKLWNTFHRPDLVEKACKTSIKNLQCSYLDLYLIHWPHAYKEDGELFPKDENEKIIFSDVDYVDTWKAMEKLVENGLVKSIGLSNFNKRQIERVLAIAKIKPAVLQVECHPYHNQQQLLEYCNKVNIKMVAYSPLGSPDRPWAKPDEPKLLEDPKIKAIADKYKKSPAQVLLRYLNTRGCGVIPKTVNKNRLIENKDIFDFSLEKADLEALDSFNRGFRFCAMGTATGHPHHPFENDPY